MIHFSHKLKKQPEAVEKKSGKGTKNIMSIRRKLPTL